MVENRPKRMRKAVTQLTALVDAAWRLRSGVAADASGEGELLKEALQPRRVFTLVGVHLGVSALEVSLRQDRGCPVTWPGDIDRVQIVFVDQPVEVNVSEALSGVRAPVAK